MEKAQEWNKDELKRFLETAPLYTTIVFEGQNIPEFKYLERLIPELSGYCPNCKTDRLFHLNEQNKLVSLTRQAYDSRQEVPYPLNPRDGFLTFAFHCSKNGCGLEKKVFVYYTHNGHVEEGGGYFSHITLAKCGEYPSLKPRVDEAILKVFPNDAELLKKAVKCLRTGYGVGAFAYLRQVLEKRIDVIISEIRKNAEEQGDTEAIKKLNELSDTSPESEKIKIAKDALPANLQSKGHNPLGLLYKTLSEGIHGLSDSECLGKANAIYGALTYILKTLAENSASRKEYEASLKFLSK